jgi:hypothetical protein
MKAEETGVFASPVVPLRPQDEKPMTEEEREEFLEKFKEKCRIDEERYLREKQKQREQSDREVARLFAELQERTKDTRKLPFDWEEWERECREEEEFDKGVPMYDWGAKQPSNRHQIIKKYGSAIAEKLWLFRMHGEYVPTEIVAEMHRIHEGKLPRRAMKANQVVRPAKAPQREKTSQINWDAMEKHADLKPTEYWNDHFSTVKAGLFNVARVISDLQNPTTLLVYLLQHRAWEGKKDKHDTYNTWYLKRRLIVASVGVEKICADFGVHEKTVRNWLKGLHKSGIIRKVKAGLDNVYVLGEIIDGKELFYYSGEISCNKNPSSLH